MITQTVTFADRKPDAKIVYLGNEDENHAESIKFALPAWLSAARASLFLSLGDYTDIVSLEPTRIYKPTLTHMSRPGVYSAYITAALGDDIVWNSDIFQIFIRDLPEYAEQIEQTYPTAVEQAMKAAAEAMKAASEAAKVTGMTARAVELPAGAEPTANYADGVLTIGIPLGNDVSEELRMLISGLTDRLNALADSDDTTLDQLSEVVAYIKSNRELIAAVTTDKVSVADIIDNLTTNVANKPLSAAQGVVLKALIDAITIPEALPNPNVLTFTGAVSGSYDGSEPLTVNIPSSGSGATAESGYVEVFSTTIEEEVSAFEHIFTSEEVEILADCKRLYLEIYIEVPTTASDSAYGTCNFQLRGYNKGGNIPYTSIIANRISCIPKANITWQTYCNVSCSMDITDFNHYAEVTQVIKFQNSSPSLNSTWVESNGVPFSVYKTNNANTSFYAEASSAFSVKSKFAIYALR